MCAALCDEARKDRARDRSRQDESSSTLPLRKYAVERSTFTRDVKARVITRVLPPSSLLPLTEPMLTHNYYIST